MPLIGRERALATVIGLLGREDAPLVTLTGPGGVGKTRLALAAAHAVTDQFPDGVTFVPMASLTNPDDVPLAIAQALGIRELGPEPLTHQLARHLGHQSRLLLLDNFEQVVIGAPVIAGLVGSCPGLTVLVTSRVRLRLADEHEFPVPPLDLPPTDARPEQLTDSAAIRFFVNRAQAVTPEFALTARNATAVAEVCRRLDGLPLAISLAAPWIRVLSVAALRDQLEPRLPLLTGGSRDLPARQQTMQATIAWSYDLLSPTEQELFRHVAVFAGGCTLTAAAAVLEVADAAATTVLPGMAALAEKSLLVKDDSSTGEPRFVMLETVREFGRARLATLGEAEAARQRHAEYFLALAEQRAGDLPIPGDYAWVERVAPELNNLRLALDWLQTTGDHDGLLRLAAALYELWLVKGLYGEGRLWLDRALVNTAPKPTPSVIRAVAAAGVLAAFQRDHAMAAQRYEQELALARQLGDPYRIAEALIDVGHLAYLEADAARAETHTGEAERLLRVLEAVVPAAKPLAATALANLGDAAAARGELDLAAQRYDAAIRDHRLAGYRWGLFEAVCGLGMIHLRAERPSAALPLVTESLSLARELDEPMQLADALLGLAELAGTRHDLEASATLLGAVDALHRKLGSTPSPRSSGLYQQTMRRLVATVDPAILADLRANGESLRQHEAVDVAMALLEPSATAVPTPGGLPLGLTPREREVLRLLAAGYTDRAIAEALFISPRTAQSHVSNLLAKLGVNGRAEAAAIAVRRGLA